MQSKAGVRRHGIEPPKRPHIKHTMKKFSKIFAITVLVVLLLVLIPIGILATIDLNHYKATIASAVEKQTGRQLRIEGAIDKSFFPWLGVRVGELQLSNAPGFGETPFAQLQNAEVRIKLLPLLEKKLVIDKIVLHGLTLDLARNAKGVNNWDDLLSHEQATPQASVPQAPAGAPASPVPTQLAALSIGGIDIRDAALVWDDRQTQARYELSRLNVQTGAFQSGRPVNAEVGFQFKAALPKPQQSKAQGKISWSGSVDAQWDKQRYSVKGMRFTADVSGDALPVPKVAVSLAAQVDSDLQQQTASITQLRLAILGSELSGDMHLQQILAQPQADTQLQWQVTDADTLVKSLQPLLPPTVNAALLKNASLQTTAKLSLASQTLAVSPLTLHFGPMVLHASLDADHIMDNAAYRGTLAVEAFNPKPLLKDVMGSLPPMVDDKALTQLALDLQYRGTLNELSLKPLAINLDQSKIEGSASVKQFADPSLEFALNADALDLDRYMPPAAKKEDAGKPATSAKPVAPPEDAEIALPTDMLRHLKLKGELNVGQLKALNLKLAKVKAVVVAKDGVVRAEPVQAQLYKGSVTSSAVVDVRQARPQFTLTEKLRGVDFGPLLKDFMGDDYLSGVGTIEANITTAGNRMSELKQRLNGDARFDLGTGVVKYLDLADILAADYAKYLRQAAPPKDEGKTTAFRVLKGSATITNGLVKNKDLYLQSARFQVNGTGDIDLGKETIAYTANTEIINPTNQMIKNGLDKLVGVPIPVYVRGTFSQPSYSVDWEGALRKVAKQQVQQKLEHEKQKLKEKTEQKKQEELKKLEDKLKQKLKKLF